MLTDYLAFSAAADTAGTGTLTEVVNSARAYAYADTAGIGWLVQCDHCPNAHPPGHVYTFPNAGTVAPWWNGTPERDAFLGVIGLDITGADDSTRTAKVNATLGNPGGSVGAPYYGPRTLVLRGLAIAKDDVGLQAGIDWLQLRNLDSFDPCAPPNLNYYDCCPAGPTNNYRRQLRQVRVIEGPMFLEMHRKMGGGGCATGGACAVFEITFVAADPTEYAAAPLAAEPVAA